MFLPLTLWLRASKSWDMHFIVPCTLAHPCHNTLEWNAEPLVSQLKGLNNLGITGYAYNFLQVSDSYNMYLKFQYRCVQEP